MDLLNVRHLSPTAVSLLSLETDVLVMVACKQYHCYHLNRIDTVKLGTLALFCLCDTSFNLAHFNGFVSVKSPLIWHACTVLSLCNRL